ncbi:hypothetical protein KG088_18890 [Halomonas sp. TRM85114]|uniref:hypothetical protein n=1 Tax=Halomonas jincaotanensis TaxID=2810616 RepID=UPI001BD350EB|nr:hypothetical protein [Halomonas jincaotanensis]MBS9405656.1 hypothetical protein [Halomonas jincaotanensis]
MAERLSDEGVVAQVGTATVHMKPVGFALYADEFLLAGLSIPDQSRARGNTTFTPVPYYLFCRALELALKAFLLTKGESLDSLKKKYRHDLVKLWRKAQLYGILEAIDFRSPGFENHIVSANKYYKGKTFEYFDFRRWAHGYEDLPPFECFRDEVNKVVVQIKKHCFAVS